MSVLYLDASAWVKRYVQEIGSTWIHALFDSRERLAGSTLGHLEVVAALSRRLPQADLTTAELRLESDWQDMAHLPLTSEAIYRALDLTRQYKLRAADALHLATTLDLRKRLLSINEAVVFVASDNDLLAAARAAGLQVENPVRNSGAQP